MHLELGYFFQQKTDHLPTSLTYLQFGYAFNNSLVNIPKKITHLKLRASSIQKIPFLPHLKVLELGENFPPENFVVPKSVTHITFGNQVDQHLNLAENLVKIQFGAKFSKPIIHLPTHLKTLIFGQEFNQPLCSNGVSLLPSNLRKLTLGRKFANSLEYLPQSVTHLTCYCSYNNLFAKTDPIHPHITHLTAVHFFQQISFQKLNSSSVTHLVAGPTTDNLQSDWNKLNVGIQYFVKSGPRKEISGVFQQNYPIN